MVKVIGLSLVLGCLVACGSEADPDGAATVSPVACEAPHAEGHAPEAVTLPHAWDGTSSTPMVSVSGCFQGLASVAIKFDDEQLVVLPFEAGADARSLVFSMPGLYAAKGAQVQATVLLIFAGDVVETFPLAVVR